MSTKRRIIRRDIKRDDRLTPHLISLFKDVLLTDEDRKRWPIEDELNLELKRKFKLETWHIPYRRGTDRYINDEMLPRQLEKIVAAILTPYE